MKKLLPYLALLSAIGLACPGRPSWAETEPPAPDKSESADTTETETTTDTETTTETATSGEANSGVQSKLQERLDKVTDDLTTERILLRYKYRQGDVIRYRVEHLATVDTTISGNNQKTKLRSVSTKSYAVDQVAQNGEMRFAHTVEDVDMWSEAGGREAIHYNSRKDQAVPPEYERVAETVGVPISIVTIDPRGSVVRREDKIQHPNLGMGGLTIPLPEVAITIGHQWGVPMDVQVRLDDRRVKVIKTRVLYELTDVSAGIATIAVKTQVLTPVNDARVKSQLVQRLSQGEMRFDVDAGRMLSQRLDWDETVIAFNGPDSNMKYLARFTETLIEPSAPAKTAGRQEAEPTRE